MKKYFLHNGNEQQGPFEIEDLKGKNITKQTPVWREGLSDWTEAGNLEELNDLFKATTPPPFQEKQIVPPPISKTINQTKNEVQQPKKKKSKSYIYITLGVIVIIVVALSVIDVDSVGGQASSDKTYEEKVMSVEEIELSQPAKFLTADGEYNENFWGDKINVHGVITNKATAATYKDAVVRVTYYSKTKTELGSDEYTIYEIFAPNSTKKFELKISNYKDVNSIGWEVVSAVPGK